MVNYGHKFTAEEYAVSPEMTLGLDPKEITLGDDAQRGLSHGHGRQVGHGPAKRYLRGSAVSTSSTATATTASIGYTHERYGVPSLFRDNARTQADKGRLRDRSLQARVDPFPEGVRRQTVASSICASTPHTAPRISTRAASRALTSTSRSIRRGPQGETHRLLRRRSHG